MFRSGALCDLFSEGLLVRSSPGIGSKFESSSPHFHVGGRLAAAPAVFKERDAGAFALGWPDAANYGAGFFKKVGSGSGLLNCILFSGAEPVHLFLSPRLFFEARGTDPLD